MEIYGVFEIRVEEADGQYVAWSRRTDGRMINFGHAKNYEIGTVPYDTAEEALAIAKGSIDQGLYTT